MTTAYQGLGSADYLIVDKVWYSFKLNQLIVIAPMKSLVLDSGRGGRGRGRETGRQAKVGCFSC